MSKVRVYGDFVKQSGEVFRVNARIVWNNETTLLGSIIMLNPGESKIADKYIWDNWLKSDDDSIYGELSKDQTMHKIIKITESAYEGEVNGYIEIYNLFNLRNQNANEAIKWLQLNDYKSRYAYTSIEDMDFSSFVWIAWGKNKYPMLKSRRKEFIDFFRKQRKQNIVYHDEPSAINLYTCYHPLVRPTDCPDYPEKIVKQLKYHIKEINS